MAEVIQAAAGLPSGEGERRTERILSEPIAISLDPSEERKGKFAAAAIFGLIGVGMAALVLSQFGRQ